MKNLLENNDIPGDLSPMQALNILKGGNFRFINKLNLSRDLLQQVNKTRNGQWPFATILSCMDSRTSAELIFDMGLGDIFSIRVAGNIISTDILGSLEYATAVAKSKLIVVLGHTNCGAVKGACDHVKMGHLTSLLNNIKPAVMMEKTTLNNRTSTNATFVNEVAKLNAINSVKSIWESSLIIRQLVDEGNLGIVPAMYDVATGKVTCYEEHGIIKQYNDLHEVA